MLLWVFFFVLFILVVEFGIVFFMEGGVGMCGGVIGGVVMSMLWGMG